MADTNAQADIRGLNVDKLVRGFADQEFLMKKLVRNASTNAREIRWFQKTAGVLDSVDTTAITASQIYNTSSKSLPVVVEPSWTRNTSYVKKYFVESPLLSEEDIKDNDIDMLATCIRDLVRAVAYQVDTRIYNVLTESLSPSLIQTGAATADGWDDTATGDPILDLLAAKKALYDYNYDPEGAILYINQVEYKNLLNFLISVKGSSIPSVSSDLVKSGVVMEILGLKVVVSPNATTDYAVVFNKEAVVWKSFMPIQSAVVQEVGIGRKVRIWEEGEALLTDPKAVYLITDTVA